jgi:intracellular sulfur oxidation DsrE/DsrF family protein
MAKYLLIESRDPFDTRAPGFFHELAKSLAQRDQTVAILLVQNGVLAARAGATSTGLAELSRAGIEILAEAFALSERGIARERLAPGVAAAPLKVVIERMEQGWKTIWH